MRTLFFDIDGTLLTMRGGGKAAMTIALRAGFGVADPDVEIRFDGRTDTGLMVDLLRMNRLEVSDANRKIFRRHFSAAFPQCLESYPGHVFPGVERLLATLSGSGKVRVAAMTGNLPETATRKLEHLNLRHYVQWIVGGDLDLHRDQMAARALAQLHRRYGAGASQDIVVIGDTLADIQCARAIGAQIVAVCTGGTSREMLQAAGPDALWDDFSDWQSVANQLTGQRIGDGQPEPA